MGPHTCDERKSLVHSFREMVARYPLAVALSDGSRHLTYADVDRMSDRLAAFLRAGGIGTGSFAGVLVERTMRTPVAILGVLKSGAAYVPLDPAYPRHRISYMVDDAGIEVLVGSPADARTCGLDGLVLVDPDAVPASGDDVVPASDIGKDDPAYIIYTSGSTGLPKGCVVSHANVLALLDSALPMFDFAPNDRWTIYHSYSFDFSVWELWGAWLSGGAGVCVPAAVARSAEDFLHFLDRERITILNQVPSIFRALVHARREAPESATRLRYVIFGGESVDLASAAEFLEQNIGVSPKLVNMYGITEITVHATFKELGREDLAGGCASPIGTELPHLRITIRDSEGALVQDGQPGEMWISGTGVALGYFNRPELTAKRFVETVGADGAERSYRTGDMARRLPDGQLEYQGRNDEQVKLRGFRIELPEIEATLRSYRLVQDAAVTVVARASSGGVLTAYLVAAPGANARDLVRDARRHVAEKLPSYMVPGRYTVVDHLPLTPSGKLDRKALSHPR